VITGIRIRNYKGIKGTEVRDLGSFHVLAGPNGSGKSSFLDAIEFIKDCVTLSPLSAVEMRVPNFRDLTFNRHGGTLEFDLYLRLEEPEKRTPSRLHYRLTVSKDDKLGVAVSDELLERVDAKGGKRLLGKTDSGNDFYRRESGTCTDSFQFGRGKLALSLTPQDLQPFPTGNAVRGFLAGGVRFVQLNSVAMREPAAATRPKELELDGTNPARVVGRMLTSGEGDAVERWTEHLRYALEDLESINWAARRAG
jgi:hypothetical protein